MKYKVGDKVRVKKNLKAGKIYGYDSFVDSMEKYRGRILTIKQVPKYGFDYVVEENLYGWTDEMLEPVTNRSKVGKKAYKTFLKNGGSRNSKGQFNKKFSWQKVYDEVREVSNYIDFLVETEKIVKWDRITKIYLKVFQKHGLIKEGVDI